MSDADLLGLSQSISDAARRGAELRASREGIHPDLRILVNRRVDIALAIGADGVHLGFDGMRAQDARALLGPSACIGRSLHAAAEYADGDALSYVHLAPIYDPVSKPATRPALGADALRPLASARCAVIAQGGISPARVGPIIAAGADGIAVTGAISLQADPGAAARALRRALDDA